MKRLDKTSPLIDDENARTGAIAMCNLEKKWSDDPKRNTKVKYHYAIPEFTPDETGDTDPEGTDRTATGMEIGYWKGKADLCFERASYTVD